MWIICVKRNSNVVGREKFVHTQAYIHIYIHTYMKSRHSSQKMQFITPNSGQSAFHTTNVFGDHIQIQKINNEVKMYYYRSRIFTWGGASPELFIFCHTPKHKLSILSSSWKWIVPSCCNVWIHECNETAPVRRFMLILYNSRWISAGLFIFELVT
jgi:hypothetical protein